MAGASRTWEYLTVDALDPKVDLAALGREGWELVGSFADNAVPMLCFKRQGLDFRERVTIEQKRRAYEERGIPYPEPAEAPR